MSIPMASSIVGIGPTWLGRRQMGLKNPLGTKSHIYEQMYSSILPHGSWDDAFNDTYTSVHGGVFCLEFSPEGSLLVAACEKRSVLMFDPLTHKRIHSVENAHLDCVNCVRFLDSRSFATCSDDFTVALWDARNLNQKVRSLKGHSNWVKNIEYSPHDGLLVTSGFDGSILTWEMNTYREDGIVYNKVFSTNGLMRTRLTPDATKMIICTTGGYLIIVHNLDLTTMSQDLEGFKPNMYRLMQLSQTILPIASDFTHLFRGQGKRNRIEFITDFPEGDDAEVVSSLQIHPDGHSAISRNVSNNEKSEWSCIHNIEERMSSDDSDVTDDDSDETDCCKIMSWPGTATSISTTPSYIIQHTIVQNDGRASSSQSSTENNSEQHDLSISPTDVWEALVAIQEARIRRETDRMEMSVGHMFRRQAMDAEIQSRPINFDNQIFVTRILPNMSNSSANERRTQENSAPVFRRDTPSNTAEIIPRTDSHGHVLSLRSIPKRKIPVRRRYSSLYRRSLVGQYDRTSILRKPIYNRGIIEFEFRKFKKKFKLHTNYEMNETKRLQNVLGCASGSLRDEISGEAPDEACTSKMRLEHEANHPFLPKQVHADTRNGLRQPPLPPVPSSSVNSRRQHSTGKSPPKNLDSHTSLPNKKSENSELSWGGEDAQSTEENPVVSFPRSGSFNSDTHPKTSVGNSLPEDDDPAAEHSSDRSEPVATSSKESSILSTENPSVSSSKDERTILMGVFKAGAEDGIRGTSMRRHNVAAVTVSSPTPSESSSSENVSHAGRHKSKCNANFRNKHEQNSNSNSNCKSSTGSTSGNKSIECSSQRYPFVPINRKIHQNTKRLTHYVEEPNLGRGFIKELCVSPDGRIICSPFGNGIRLLSFSPTVQDVFHCYPPSPPIPLHELTLNIAHTDIVVSTKFSPFHNLLVSGCLSGKIVYYQPSL